MVINWEPGQCPEQNYQDEDQFVNRQELVLKDELIAERRLLNITPGKTFVMLLSPGTYLMEAVDQSVTKTSAETLLKSFLFNVSTDDQVIYIGDLNLKLNQKQEVMDVSVVDNTENLVTSVLPSLKERLKVNIMTILNAFPAYNVTEHNRDAVTQVEPELIEKSLVAYHNRKAKNAPDEPTTAGTGYTAGEIAMGVIVCLALALIQLYCTDF